MPSINDESRALLEQLRQAEQPTISARPTISAPTEEQTAGSRMGYVGLGGTVGALLGSAAGPLGTLGGGALGAAAGSMVSDITSGRSDPLEQIGRAAKEALFDLGIGAGSMAVRGAGKAAVRGLTRKVAGIGPRETAQAARSAELGIPQDAMSMATKPFPEKFARVVGKVPIAGAPIRKSAQKRMAAGGEMLTRQAKKLGETGLDQKIMDAFTRDARGNVTKIDFGRLDRSLGFNNPGGKRFKQTIEKVIGAEGADVKDFVQTYELAKKAWDHVPADVADMIARRWTLGGVSLAGLTGMGALYTGTPGVIAAATFLSLVREGASALSNPSVLKPLKQALRPGARDGFVIGATIRALRAMNDDEADALADDIESNVNG